MRMKNLLALTCTLMLSLNAYGADGSSTADPQELIVFAAASMTETLTTLGDTYMAENPDVNIVFNFDSSGTLKTQIEEGADVDIFISAGQKQMDQLDINASSEINTDGLDFVLEGTRFDILENKVALAVPSDNSAGIQSYDDMAAKLKDGSIMLAMGNADVPVGQYTQKILTYYELSEEDLSAAGCITYGSNVKEVTTQVSEETVDWGMELAVREVGFENASFIGIRMHYLRPGEGENSVLCHVVGEIENPFSYVIMLCPDGSKDTVPVRWETDKAIWESVRGDTISMCLPPEFLIPLK